MPELPEVETITRVLKEMTQKKKITSVDVLRPQTIDSDVTTFKQKLRDQTILDFSRVGKFIIFHLTNNLVIISHLRMEGKYFLKAENEELTKHDLVVFHFSDKTKLIYNDTRKFGRMSLSTKEKYLKELPLCNVGPDPFMMSNASILKKAFKSKSIAIKTALLDQSIMSGLGNIYVDEVLFETKIHPETPAKLVSEEQIDNILEQSKIVLKKAIDAGGSTIKSYHPREGISGNFQVSLKVYGKKGSTCVRCGNKLNKIFVNGRGTTYCSHCQQNPADKKVIGITGPVASGKSTICKYFINKGYVCLDCDKIVHDLYKQKNIQEKLKKYCPELKIINGEIDRKYLLDIFLNEPKTRTLIEKYIHNEVKKYIEQEIKKSTKNIIIEAPLLYESGLDAYCNEVIFVFTDKETQIRHLESRNSNVDKSLVLNANFNKNNKKKATYVINNNNDIASLNKLLDSIFYK